MSGAREFLRRAIKILRESDDPWGASALLSSKTVILEGHDTWYGFYATLTLEAFQYEAATGSIKAIEWFFICFKQKRFSNFRDQYLILVDIGFTFYNFTRDLKYRYGALSNEIIIRFKQQFKTFQTFVDLLPKSSSTRFLQSLKDLIYVGFVTSSCRYCSQEDYCNAMKLAKKVIYYDHYYQGLSPILCGLAVHHAAKLFNLTTQVHEHRSLTPIQLYANAIVKLRAHAEKSDGSASYFYDAIGGKSHFQVISAYIARDGVTPLVINQV